MGDRPVDDYALVLNAGSSSLKFCVYRRPQGEAWRLEARGQIEGIGTSPHFTAKDGAGAKLADEALGDDRPRRARRARCAGRWLRAQYGGARVLGVGHRVVHGGADVRGAGRRHARGARASCARWCRWRRCISRTTWPRSRRSRSGCRACRRSPASTPASTAASRRSPSWCRCRRRSATRGVQRYGFHGLSYEYIASVLPEVAPEIADGRVIVAHLGSGASLCALTQRQERRQHARLHRARRPVHGHAARRARSGRRPPPVPDPRPRRARRSRRCSTRSRACSASPASATTCATCSATASRRARLAVDYFVYRAAKEIGALAAVLGGVDGLVFTAGIGEHSAEIRRRICEASAWLGIELDDAANEHAWAADLERRTAACRPGWSRPTKNSMIARHTGRCWACRGPRLSAGGKSRHHDGDRSTDEEDRNQRTRPWEGFQTGPLAEGDQRPRLHPAELHALRRRRVVPRAGDRAHAEDLGPAEGAVRRGAQEGRARRLADPELDHRARARLHRPRQRDHRRARRPTRRSSARSCRTAASGWCSARSRPTATRPIRTSSRRSPSTARRTTRPCSTPTRPTSAAAAARTSSPDCPTPTAAAGSSATTGASRSTASTG